MAVCEINLRPGGAYRYVLQSADGSAMGIHGVYREITPPQRLVYTQIFEGWMEGEAVLTMDFVENAGQTTMTITVLNPSKEYRDAVINANMEHGAAESYDRLANLLASQA